MHSSFFHKGVASLSYSYTVGNPTKPSSFNSSIFVSPFWGVALTQKVKGVESSCMMKKLPLRVALMKISLCYAH